MPAKQPEVVITAEEKAKAIKKLEAQLEEWRRANPEAPKRRPVKTP